MNSETAHSEIRSALRAELKRRHGQIGQIEAAMDRSEGYLSRFCRGDMEISLKGLLDALEILEIEPGSFFGASLGGVSTSIAILKRCEGLGSFHKGLSSIEEALEDLQDERERSKPQRLHQVCLEEFLEQPVSVQIRRLKTSKKYRQPGFVRDLLRHVDDLRYEDAEGAVRLVVSVAESLLVGVTVEESDRIELVCMTLAIYSSSIRLTGEFRSAIRAARLGLELAEDHRLYRARVELLERAAYALGSQGRFEEALILLREGLEVAFEKADQRLLGRVLFCQGLMHGYLGRQERAADSMRRVLDLLPENDQGVERWRLAALQHLAVIRADQNELAAACRWLEAAVDSSTERSGLHYAKLLWQKGRIELAAEQYEKAEKSLRSAHEILKSLESPEFALLSIDLVKALLKLGKRAESIQIAKQMAVLVDAFDQSEILEAAVLEFLRIVLQGELSESVLDEYRSRLEKVAERA